jgi:hypothetical protein
MMARLEGSTRGVVFDIKEMIIHDSFTVAVRVGSMKDCNMFQTMHQFLFLFCGKVITGIKEERDINPLSEIFSPAYEMY